MEVKDSDINPKAGIREVVEWIKAQAVIAPFHKGQPDTMYWQMSTKEWEDKLKEWSI
jgi:hypothetical protein